MSRLSIILLIVWVGAVCSSAGAVEIKHWERLPLAVPLVVGQERILLLDEDVRVGVPLLQRRIVLQRLELLQLHGQLSLKGFEFGKL